MNKYVRVYWESEGAWYKGIVSELNPVKGYHVQYEDGDEEWIAEEDTRNPHLFLFEENFDYTDDSVLLMKNPCYEEDEVSVVVIPQNQSRQTGTAKEEEEVEEDEKEDAASVLVLSEGRQSDFVDPLSGTLSSEGDGEDIHSISSLIPSEDIVLATGKVINVTIPIGTASIRKDTTSQLFFRVLYAGGDKSKSNIFQCKTSVFESELASNEISSQRVTWNRNAFHFEMDRVQGAGVGSADAPSHGDIIFALYQQRSTGGREFMGQAVLSVAKICAEGSRIVPTMQSSRDNRAFEIETRKIRDVFALFDRSNSSVIKDAFITVELTLSWRSENSMIYVLPSQNAVNSNIAAKPPRPLSSGLSRGSASSISSMSKNSKISSNKAVACLISVKIPGVLRSNQDEVEPQAGRVVPNKESSRNTSARPEASRLNKAQKEFRWKVERENKSMHNRLIRHATKTGNGKGARGTVYGGDKPAPLPVGNIVKGTEEERIKERRSVGKRVTDNDKEDENIDVQEETKLLQMLNKLRGEVAAVTDENKELAGKLSRYRIQSRRWEVSQERVTKTSAGNNSGSNAAVNEESRPQNLHYLRLLERKEKVARDPELSELLEEYRYLQDSRRALRSRLVMAERLSAEAQRSIDENRRKIDLFSVHVVAKTDDCNKDEGDGRKRRLLSKLRDAKIDLMFLEGLEEMSLYSGEEDGTFEERSACLHFVRERLEIERREVETLTKERDELQTLLQRLRNKGKNEDTAEESASSKLDSRGRIEALRGEIIQKRVELALPPFPTLFVDNNI